MMLIIGLTGSIGMGKSVAAARFRALAIPVSDADAVVHEIYATDAVAPVEAAFPGTTTRDGVDRNRLSQHLLSNPAGFAVLENIVHPMVRNAQRAFLCKAAAENKSLAVLEIPLLFETSGNERVDVTVVVSATSDLQRQRVMARPGMTDEKLTQILSRQMSDAEKRRRADFVVDTSRTIAETDAQIDTIVAALGGRCGHAFDRYWSPQKS